MKNRPLLAALLLATCAPAAIAQTANPTQVQTITVTASRVNLIGRATTASQGKVTKKELELRPVYRVGQLLESVPGLVVTVHSGEGKANQYLVRGFNLDHGTDIANFIDGMPVNLPTNTHGQGYSDLNFFIPQMFGSIDYGKGPFFASVGDFGAVAWDRISLIDDLPAQVSVSDGTLGDQEAFVGGTYHFKDGVTNLIGALDLSHVDGPSQPPQNFRKIAANVRLVHGTDTNGYSLTAMYFKGQGRNTTDIPLRAINEGLVGEYDSLDPTDGNRTDRWSVSGDYDATGTNWKFASNLYVIHRSMTLWNDFTHYLNDPINGDQEAQDETRTTAGGAAAYTYYAQFRDIESDWTVGLQERYDTEYIDRRHTRDRAVLDYCNDGNGNYSVGEYACTANLVQLEDVSPYIQNTTHWLSWLRTTLGAREDYYYATDKSVLASFPFNGNTNEFLLQPKGSVAVGPFYNTEAYFSIGRGFHSDDVRGVLQSVPIEGVALSAHGAPLMAKTLSEEVGLRNNSYKPLQVQIAAFRQDFSSELMYDQDAGADAATAPSRRLGVEFSAQYQPFRWIEFNTDLAVAHARYFENADKLANYYAITGGDYIALAPNFTGSFGVLVSNLGPWSGALEQRILGSYPLTDGPKYPRAKGYSETNFEVGYQINPKTKLEISIFNVFDSHAYSAEYYYATDITPAEVAKYGTGGVNDYQVHLLEPRSGRATLTYVF